MASPGKSLGPYEILGSLGAGGMGEVFRARDPRLGREVAIKILPAEFSADLDRLRRFEQEARAAAALNHPHIVSVFDIGKSASGAPYIVTELLEGETLRERLRSGPLSARKAAEYGAQIARGLAAAHEKGIIHRDLKPENIFITRQGVAKILDFGLAKLHEPHELAASPTDATKVDTRAGMILGTFGYMSPEQVRGEAVDARSDIFSFGAVLHEIVSGRRAFAASTSADTMAAILREEPQPLDDKVPPALQRIITHCLEKAPSERFQSARDLAFQLDSAVSGSSVVMAPERIVRKRRILPAVLLIAVAAIAALLAWRLWPKPVMPKAPVSISHLTDFVGLEESPALSPDGKYVAFTADHSGNRQVMIRLLSGGAPLQITNDQADHTSPRWSADSGSIVYYVPPTTADEKEGTVWQVSALGGSQRRLFSSISDVDISHQGAKVAYFAVNGDKTELRVADLDGMHSRTVKDFPSNLLLFHPRWSPDDSQIAFQIGDWPNGRIAAISANGGQMRDITSGQVYTRGFAWLPKGDGIVVSSSLGSSVFYQATLNLWEYSLKGGAPRQLTFNVSSYVDPDISSTGQMVATHVDAQYNIWRIPVSGDATENVKNAVQVTRQTGLVQTPSVSPDDRYLVYLADAGRHANLWILDIEKGDRRQLTFEEDPNVMIGVPIWSPDGKHIAYFTLQYSGKDWFSRNQEWVIDPDGSNPRALVDAAAFACWSPDSKWVYFAENRGQGYTGLGRVSLDGKVEKVRPENEKGLAPAISPDGKSLYFVLNSASENGRIKSEIRVASLPDGPSRLLTTISGSMIPAGVPVIQPIVSPDGKWLALLLHGQNNDEIWLLSPAGGTMHRMTDFGDRRISLARRVSWSPDSRFIYAALGDHDSDIVSIADLVAH